VEKKYEEEERDIREVGGEGKESSNISEKKAFICGGQAQEGRFETSIKKAESHLPEREKKSRRGGSARMT